MTVLIDSYAWFEYFFGSPKGKRAGEFIESGERIVVSQINLIEVYAKYLRSAKGEAEEKKRFMMNRSEIIDVTNDISLKAAKLKAEEGLSLADAIILATAQKEGVVLVTGDKHFSKFDRVKLI
ncbi:MAG: type II toxin-antitoxin system VapC family toxin [Candidatus Micrarchaeota archaeon]|nr:type II toxin-antitoxin system VapC family toxin [Candidatus Micrarchaeota archaeon]